MRYQDLREAREHLQHAHAYLDEQTEGVFLTPVREAMVMIEAAAMLVKKELKRPESFNTDGSPRMVRIFDSSKAQQRGTFPPEPVDIATASRQVRRAMARALGFNQMSFPRVTQVPTGKVIPAEDAAANQDIPETRQVSGRSPMIPRAQRKFLARRAKIDKPKPVEAAFNESVDANTELLTKLEDTNGNSEVTGTTTPTQA